MEVGLLKREPRTSRIPVWLGLLGVLVGVFLALVVLTLGMLGSNPAVVTLIVVPVPALSGFLVRVRWTRTRSGAISSIGTSLGWLAFIVPLFTQSPVLVLLAILPFPIDIVGVFLMIFGLILLGEWLMARLARLLLEPPAVTDSS